MRRPNQLRLAALLGGSASAAFALLLSLVVYLLLGRVGRLDFDGFNFAGLLQGLVFIAAFVTALRYARSALRLPSPTLLSFGLSTPPTAAKVAASVPTVDAAGGFQTMAENRIVIVQEAGVPIGLSGVRHDRITSWDDLVKIDGGVGVTDLRSVLAHEPLVVVVSGERVLGIITQEMYLGGLWGTVR